MTLKEGVRREMSNWVVPNHSKLWGSVEGKASPNQY